MSKNKVVNYNKAIEAYKQAIRHKPDYAEAPHYDLGLSYLLLGDKGSAIEEYKTLKDLDKEKQMNCLT
jgi:tetratricopeptide (TPR) repeat protein